MNANTNSELLTVSPAPHVKGDQTTQNIMMGVIYALVPALIVSILFFGLGAIKVTLTAIASCMIFEYLIQKHMLKGENTIVDGSAAVTGLLLAFNLPSNLPIWMIIVGSLIAIGVGKMSFGGLGNNPFNPALVGRVFLLISFPVEMTSWPLPQFLHFELDSSTGATALSFMKEGGSVANLPSHLKMFLGDMGGSLGEVSALALVLGGIYMMFRKIITWHIPISYIGTVFVFTGILWLVNDKQFADPLFHLLSGGLMLGAIFMATDMVTSPMTGAGMILFGIGCGVITVAIRLFGAYPEGVSFAILIMNAVVPLINIMIKPKRFGVR